MIVKIFVFTKSSPSCVKRLHLLYYPQYLIVSQYLVVGTDLLMTVFVELYADLSEF